MNRHEADGPRDPEATRRRHPPAFNVPAVVLGLIAVFAVVHWVRADLLGPVGSDEMILDYAFIPGCYGGGDPVCALRSAGAGIWSPITYAFLHGDWTHFGANAVWLLAFGTPVARRIGAARFLSFSALGSIAGALVFYLVNPTLVVPVIGASGTVSALMGGACRFAFGGSRRQRSSPDRMDLPLITIFEALSDRTVLIFIAVFFGTNLLVGSGLGGAFSGGAQVAWEAHLGGFAFGFLFFRAFDPRSPVPSE